MNKKDIIKCVASFPLIAIVSTGMFVGTVFGEDQIPEMVHIFDKPVEEAIEISEPEPELNYIVLGEEVYEKYDIVNGVPVQKSKAKNPLKENYERIKKNSKDFFRWRRKKDFSHNCDARIW